MIFDTWAKRWGIPPEAVREYRQMVGIDWAQQVAKATENDSDPMGSESRQQSIVRLDAAQHDVLLFRNNSGAMKNPDTGGFVRFGLANESKQMNEMYKSHDLVGVRRVRITASMVGTDIGQFTTRECKKEGWHFTGTDREVAQARWGDLINSYGGDAQFATGKGTF